MLTTHFRIVQELLINVKEIIANENHDDESHSHMHQFNYFDPNVH